MPDFIITLPEEGFRQMRRYPFFSHAVYIRVGNIQRSVRNREIAGQFLYPRSVRERERPQEEPVRFKGWL